MRCYSITTQCEIHRLVQGKKTTAYKNCVSFDFVSGRKRKKIGFHSESRDRQRADKLTERYRWPDESTHSTETVNRTSPHGRLLTPAALWTELKQPCLLLCGATRASSPEHRLYTAAHCDTETTRAQIRSHIKNKTSWGCEDL